MPKWDIWESSELWSSFILRMFTVLVRDSYQQERLRLCVTPDVFVCFSSGPFFPVFIWLVTRCTLCFSSACIAKLIKTLPPMDIEISQRLRQVQQLVCTLTCAQHTCGVYQSILTSSLVGVFLIGCVDTFLFAHRGHTLTQSEIFPRVCAVCLTQFLNSPGATLCLLPVFWTRMGLSRAHTSRKAQQSP